jgi:uncharacterized protein YllA (UPF0747 family)
MDGNQRTRIVKSGDEYLIGEQNMNLQDALDYMDLHPEKFSPNAALRPLYQEYLLPNLCYVGGMAEMHYWSQLKGVFNESKVPYPLLQMRSNILWITEGWSKKMNKAHLNVTDLFKTLDALKKSFLDDQERHPIDQEKIDSGLKEIESAIRLSISEEKGLEQWMGSELKKIEKSINQIKNRINREKKKSYEVELSRVEKIKEALFPNGGLQERHVNLLHFCNNSAYREMLEHLFSAIDPLTDGWTVAIENKGNQSH